MRKKYGKYRGKVVNNVDPQQMGCLLVRVAAISDDNGIWAQPCVPFAGPGVGFFTIPPIGANVWVEFEEGDPDSPIWSGCFWGKKGDAPAPHAFVKVLKTDLATVTINDTPGVGGIKIETALGAKIEITAQGIEINNGMGGTITLKGPQVSINNGALEVI